MSADAEPLTNLVRETDGEPEGALVLMHGRGADETDLVGILDVLDPKRRLLGVTPGGPLHLPPGGKHWYAVPRVGYPDPPTFEHGFRSLTAFLDGLGLDWSRTILGGFSQGAVMSFAIGLGEGRPLPAGIVAFSGFIPTVEGWSPREDIPAGFPVAIGHGTMDPIISIDFGRAARDRLVAAGADVTYHESAIPHTIDPRFVGTLPAWVDAVVPPR